MNTVLMIVVIVGVCVVKRKFFSGENDPFSKKD